jgi:hypothetical protein
MVMIDESAEMQRKATGRHWHSSVAPEGNKNPQHSPSTGILSGNLPNEVRWCCYLQLLLLSRVRDSSVV